MFLRGALKKKSDSIKMLYFRQSVLHKIFILDVFYYIDVKFESWHRAKQFRKLLLVKNSSHAIFTVKDNRVWFNRRFKTIITKYITIVEARKVLKNFG